ncbi:MAG: twin-arginine translocase TatA/TatE family subunit [Armatimonadetes bacterium]|nr:twin-arginine translocase TatA/TatE family subunit [Armatimonadota bacterium]
MNNITHQLALFGGGQEWLLILVLVLILFGGSKIPQLMRGVGQGVGELQKGLEEGKKGITKAAVADDDEKKSP